MFKYPGQRTRPRPPPASRPSPPPLTNLPAFFDYHDYDRSNYLTKAELVHALRTTPGFSNDEREVRSMVDAIWGTFDRNGDGRIDKREFCTPGGLGEALLSAQAQQRQPVMASQPAAAGGVFVPGGGSSQPYVPAGGGGGAHQPYVPGGQPYAPPPAHAPTYVPDAGGIGGSQPYVPQATPVVAPSAPPAQSPSSDSHSSDYWNCPRCTFVNASSDARCKACGGPAPPGAHHPAPAQAPSYNQTPVPVPVPTPTSNSTETIRVHVPPGMAPHQKVKVRPPSGGSEVVVTIPDRSQWRYAGGGAYFDITVPRQQQPVVVQGTAIQHNMHNQTHVPSGPKPEEFIAFERFRSRKYESPPLGMQTVQLSPSPVSASGRRKALLIGINYNGTRAQLRGCVNDAKNIQRLLLQNGFQDDSRHMVLLADEGGGHRPTKENILKGFQWLVQGVAPGDVLFFHFSGHGAQVPDKSGMEADGFNETILPVDYSRAGQIADDILWASLVHPLPSGVRMTAIMDCCHSGTGLDLPYEWKMTGKHGSDGRWVEDVNPAHSKGDVVLLSGCEDSQTSADAVDRYTAGGAMTQSFLAAIAENPMPTYPDLLRAIHKHLKRRRFTQRPQLTSTQRFDARNRVFSFKEGIEPNGNGNIGRIKNRHIRPGRQGFGGGGDSSVNSLLFAGGIMAGAAALADMFS